MRGAAVLFGNFRLRSGRRTLAKDDPVDLGEQNPASDQIGYGFRIIAEQCNVLFYPDKNPLESGSEFFRYRTDTASVIDIGSLSLKKI